MKVVAFAALLVLLAAPAAAFALPGAVPHTHQQPLAPGAAPAHGHLPAPWSAQVGDALFLRPESPVPLRSLPGSADGYRVTNAVDDYTLTFRCPSLVESEGGLQSTQCPAFLLDVEDIMAQPVLVVDPRDNQKIAFHALHGGPGARVATQSEPFTAASRDDYLHQPHTVFQSDDGGQWFDDNRYYSPIRFSYPEIFGEDNALTLDHRGNLLVSSLYSYRETADSPLRFAFFNWQSETIDVPFQQDANYVRRDPRDATAAVHELHNVYDRATRTMAVFWLEEGGDGRRFIEGDWVQVGEGAWDAIPNQTRLGPCSDMTNVVESGDRLYVGCVAAEGYPLPDGATVGQLMIHRYDPRTWNHTFVGVAPVPNAAGSVLASAEAWASRGIAVAGAALENGAPSVITSLGIDGQDWTATAQYGDRLTDRVNRNTAPLEVRINALAYVPSTGVLHFVYYERYPAAQETNLTATTSGPSALFKTYGVTHGSGQFLGAFAFGYGDPQTRANFAIRTQGTTDAAFQDQHDSIVVVPRGNQDRVFLAIGDHGYVRFGEVIQETVLGPTPPILPATVPIPAPIPAVNPAIVGAVAGALSLSVVGRMAAARNKKAAETPA